MSRLLDRIRGVGTVEPQINIIGKDYRDVKAIPLTRIQIYPGVVSYEDTYPLIAPDGGLISATGAGTWGQLYAAGKR
jgi:hypothetical protein